MDPKVRISVFGAAVLLSIWGLQVSIELTRIHYLMHTDPGFHAACALSEAVNCETVALSPYAVFAGLPVSVWGISGYLSMALLALWGLSKQRRHPLRPLGGMTLLTTLSVCSSVVLAYISVTKIDSVCTYCIRTYVINSLLFVLFLSVALRHKPMLRVLLFEDVVSILKHPVPAILIGVAILSCLVALALFVPPYWDTVGFHDLPKLPTGTDAKGQHWIGAKQPLLTITEFSDYECPHCRKSHKTARLLAAKYPNEVRLYHRHLPLDNACHPNIKKPFHSRACEFSKAAECAGRQDKFWEMNDALFATQDTMKATDVAVESLAVRIGLDRSDFKDCMQEKGILKQVEMDISDAIEQQISATPTFLIGNERYLGEIPKTTVIRMLREVDSSR